MIEAVRRYAVELEKPVKLTHLDGIFLTEEKRADKFEIKLTKGGKPADISGAVVAGMMVRQKDKQTVPFSGSASGDTVTTYLPDNAYNVSGYFTAAITVSMGDTTRAVFYGEGNITRNRTDRVSDPSHLVPESLSELVGYIGAMKQGTEAANNAAGYANNQGAYAKKQGDIAAEIIGTLEVEGAAVDSAMLGGLPSTAYMQKAPLAPTKAMDMVAVQPERFKDVNLKFFAFGPICAVQGYFIPAVDIKGEQVAGKLLFEYPDGIKLTERVNSYSLQRDPLFSGPITYSVDGIRTFYQGFKADRVYDLTAILQRKWDA